jgi:very-short-patch-repair endonuclease/DNA polymerase III delta prime subunit
MSSEDALYDDLTQSGLPEDTVADMLKAVRKRLIDVSGNNRLLNHRATTKTIRMLEPDLERIYSELIDRERAIPIASAPDENLLPSTRTPDLPEPCLICEIPEQKLEKRLKRIDSDSRMAIQETGLNLLYLAFGFLNWTDTKSGNSCAAPLLLVPVSVVRVPASARGKRLPFEIQYDGEDLDFNSCLAEKLRQFHIDLPMPEENDNGTGQLRPLAYFEEVEEAVEHMEGWSVSPDLVLGFFQFSKLRMYKDLSPDQWGPGGANILTHKLVTDALLGKDPTPGETIVPRDIDIERDSKAVRIPLVVDADSSQHKVLVDALDGQSLVVHGPPGTGKSQTITNLISAAMAQGKNVLFISEKMAALDVVYSNMEKIDLHHFCLVLHSARATKAIVHESIKERLALRPKPVGHIQAELNRLSDLRKKLHEYADAIRHRVMPLDETVYTILGKALNFRSGHEGIKTVPVPKAHELGKSALEHRTQALRDLQQTSSQFGFVHKGPWRGLIPIKREISLEMELLDALGVCEKLFVECADHFSGSLSCWARGEMLLEQLRNDCDTMADYILRCPAEYLNHGFCIGGNDNRDLLRDFVLKLDEFETKRALLHENVAGNWQHQLESSGTMSSNAKGSAATILADVKLQGVSAWRSCFQAMSEAAAATTDASKVLQPIASFVPLSSLLAVKQALRLSEYLTRMPKVSDLSKLVPSCDPRLGKMLSELQRQSDELASESDRLQAMFLFERLPSIDVLQTWIDDLLAPGNSMLSLFSKRAGNARSQCRRILKPKTRLAAKQLPIELEGLKRFMLAKAKFDCHPYAVLQFGSLFAGIDTPWQLLQEVQEWVSAVREILPEAVIDEKLLSLSQWPSTCQTEINDLRVAIANAEAAESELLRMAKTTSEDCESQLRILSESSLSDFQTVCLDLNQQLRSIANDADKLEASQNLSLKEWTTTAAAFAEAARMTNEIDAASQVKSILGDWFQGTSTKSEGITAVLVWHDAIGSLKLEPSAHALLQNWQPELYADILTRCEGVMACADTLTGTALPHLQELVEIDEEQFCEGPLRTCDFVSLLGAIQSCLADSDQLPGWIAYSRIRQETRGLDLFSLVEWAEKDESMFAILPEYFESCFYNTLAEQLINASPVLLCFVGLKQDGVRERFAQADRELKDLRRVEVAHSILSSHEVPDGNSRGLVSSYTDKGLIDREMEKEKRHIPIRALVRRAGNALQGLHPCFMMSPMSVAQFIAPNSLHFDLIVIDEASQLRPEDALGALARGSQVVIVGDPKQLPPTSFFDSYGGGDESEDENPIQDMESILDTFLNVIPSRMLNWHYRSQHHSLIRFSNARYYNNELIVFPSPHDQNGILGVKFRFVNGGQFGGKPGRNEVEAKTVAEAILKHAREHRGISLGVAAMSLRQREAIEDYLDVLYRDDPMAQEDVEAFNRSVPDPLFIKNLESVQGDERDVIFISCTYGPDMDSGRVFQRFGPINVKGGERRLNVLFSRSRKRMEIFSSMRSSDVVGGPQASQGARDLKAFLSYAETGNMPDEGTITDREPDSDFEVAVGKEIAKLGYELEYQLGVAGFFLDIAVRNPNRNSEFMLGIECDGATYHSSRSARDRDRLREEVIKSRGWRLHRIWSTDWFLRQPQELERLKLALESASIA